jgi:sigma-B regulation protein RsbU (phosphoserine phosphatase)
MSNDRTPTLAELLAENAELREECERLKRTSEAQARLSARAVAGFQNRALHMEIIRQKNSELAALNRELAVSLKRLKEAQDQLVEAAKATALAEKEKLERELAIASRIQTSILPRGFHVSGLDIAAQMIPATEVGGDYYDVLPVKDGCWLAIGDVAGHGLTAGLVMLMIQSIVAGIATQTPEASPSALLSVLNRVLFENVRQRLKQDEHATLSLMRYDRSGRFVFAGAHEEIVIFRAGERKFELIETPGPWMGAMADVGRFMVDSQNQLFPNDIMLLYTDGITEAMDARGKQFGIERMCAAFDEVKAEPVEVIRDHLIGACMQWTSEQFDDVTLLVARHSAPEPAGLPEPRAN